MSLQTAYHKLATEIQKNVETEIASAVAKSIEQQPIAIMTPEKFSEAIGVSHMTVQGWINKGYVPTVKIGRRRMVNHAALTHLYMYADFH